MAVGIAVRSVEVRNSRELALELASMDRERPDALLILADPLTTSERLRIVEFAAAQRLPAMYETSRFVEVGGLMSYGPNVNQIVRRAATYVDIESKAQRITIPQSVLLQADRTIE